MRVRSGVLAAWTSAWLAGEAAYDDVVARVTGDDEPHRVTGLPGVDGETPLGWALPVLRERSPDGVRAVLPVAGDPRGLPGPGPFTTAALAAGEAVRRPRHRPGAADHRARLGRGPHLHACCGRRTRWSSRRPTR